MSITIDSVEFLDLERMVVHLSSGYQYVTNIDIISIDMKVPFNGVIELKVISSAARWTRYETIDIGIDIRPKILFCLDSDQNGFFFDLLGPKIFNMNHYVINLCRCMPLEELVGQNLKDMLI